MKINLCLVPAMVLIVLLGKFIDIIYFRYWMKKNWNPLFYLVGSEAQNPCSALKMRDAYNEMKRVACKNCDKYFHCIGNYNAVKCGGILQVTTAKIMSDARELFGGGGSGSGSADSAADQEANNFGRSGGNCASKYLKAANCAYNPSTKQCKW